MFGQTSGRRARGEHPSIMRRRAFEDHYQQQDQNLVTEKLHQEKTKWASHSNNVVKKNSLVNIARGQKLLADQNLAERRQRLKALLSAEDVQYRDEVAQLQETTEQRAEKMLDRARALKTQRLATQRQIAQDAYQRQWRDGCDDLRTLESEAFKRHCLGEIAKQREAKIVNAEKEAQREAGLAEMAENVRLQLEEKERREALERKAAINDNRNALLAQMVDSRRARQEAQDRLAADRRAISDQLAKDAEDNRQAAIALIAHKRDLNNKTRDFNTSVLLRKQEAAARRQAEDKLMLDMNNAKYQKELALRADDKAARQRDMREFRDFLADQKVLESKQNLLRERLAQEEMDKVNNKRDAFMQKQADARAKLMADVHASRQAQIEHKNNLKISAQEQKALDAIQLKKMIEEEQRQTQEEEARERELALHHRTDLEKQIQNSRMRKNLEYSRAQLDRELADASEAQYRAFLERENKPQQYVPPSFGLKTAFMVSGKNQVSRS
jgi:hypothetical protein